jgi:membrane protease YdiL (CAAX protease family)
MQPLDSGNNWIAAANDARRHISPPIAIGIALATLALGLFAGSLAEQWITRQLASSPLLPGVKRAIGYACVFAPLLVVPFSVQRLYEHRTNPSTGLSSFGFGLVVGSTAFACALAASVVFHAARLVRVSELTPGLLDGMTVLLMLAAFQSWAEEYFFRGWLQPLLARRWGAVFGVLVSALLFAAAHIANGRVHVSLAITNLFLAGSLFGLLALRTGGLAAPFAAHLAWNWLERGVFGMTPNPGVDPLGSLIDIDLVGPAVLAGGRDEFNGTIEVTSALCLALAVVAARFGSSR